MRIGIDCRLAGRQHAGIGRYIENLVRELGSLSTEHTFVLFFATNLQPKEIFNGVVPKHFEFVFAPVAHYSLSEQFKLPLLFLSAKLDLLHIPHFNVPIFYPLPLIVTIHDLLWHEVRGARVTTLPVWLYWIKYFFYRLVTRIAVSRAKIILVPTKTIAQCVTKHYPQTKNKIIVSYEGCDPQLLKTSKSVPRDKNALLYVGSLYPHKNISIVFEILKKYPRLRLTIVSARNAFRSGIEDVVKTLKLSNQVIFKDAINDAALSIEYRRASVLLQPSISEGFGLTGLEALVLKTPVIASDIPIFHEIYGSLADFFNPHDAKSLEILLNKKRRYPSQTDVEKLLNKFSWNKMAITTLKAYNESTSKI